MRSFAPLGIAILVLVVSPAAATTVVDHRSSPDHSISSTSTSSDTPPAIHAIYPDPIAGGDSGEFVVLDVPPDIPLGSYVLTDGQTTITLPTISVDGRIVLTSDPAIVREMTDRPVYGLDSALELANGGDSLALRRANRTVSKVRYSESIEGEVGVVNGSTIRWRPLGATDRPVVSGRADTVRVFTLPDAPAAPLRSIRTADRRVYLAGYTLSSDRVADSLIAAQNRGADVRVLLEGEPVGGRTRTEAKTIDRLTDAGVTVRLVSGPHARYRYHHAKYAVADGRAVVLTENWKPAGTGGNSSRGWGVETSQPRIVSGLAATFRADAGWRDGINWTSYRQGRRFERGEPATETYPRQFDPDGVSVERTTLLVTPDNAQRRLVARLDGATESIAVVQPTIGGWEEPLIRALRRAASRGVEVQLLLSSAWYVREENQRTVDRFDEWATRTDVSFDAKLAAPGGRYAKIHAKGAIVDGDEVVLGSLNWNEQAATENREVVLVLHGTTVGEYYGRVFDADWSGGRPELPVGILATVGGVLVVAGLAARRIRFTKR